MTEKTSWLSLPFGRRNEQKDTFFSELETLWFERPRVVFERGTPGTWDDFGVRDPALLADARGNLFREEGVLVMYYTGSHDNGLWQGTGRGVSFDEGWSWHRSPEEAVLAPREGSWDSRIAATSWVVRGDDGIYRLYYRGARGVQEEEGIGLAISTDGIHFERVNSRPILARRDFADLDRNTLMGVINVVRMLDGRYLLTFEGNSKRYGLLQIFGSVSADGEHFHALNNGYPIFTANHVQTWPVQSVANPRVTVLEKSGVYMLAFNGCTKSTFYSLGLAFTKDLEEWWEHPANPIISPSGTPLDDPFSGRLEGGVLVKEDLERKTGSVRMFLMSIPRRGPSHKNSIIGLAQGWFSHPRRLYNFRTVSAQPGEVAVSHARNDLPELLYLHQNVASPFPPRVHFNLSKYGDVSGLSLEFRLDLVDEGDAFIVIGEELETILLVGGIRFGFSHGRIYLWSAWDRWCFRGRLQYGRTARPLRKWWPWLGWQLLGNYKPGNWQKLKLEKCDGKWTVNLDGSQIGLFSGGNSETMRLTELAIQSCLQPIRIRDLRLLLGNSQSNQNVK